jgi:chromate transporter
MYTQAVSVFLQFLLLGCMSFGGPAAHLGYFQQAFVEKLKWLSQDEYASLVSLSQLLPGPGSSQVGFAIGLHKAGLLGGIAAFVGFTLPSFGLLFALAVWMNEAHQPNWLAGLIDGLKWLAVVVVFDAIISMAKSFCQSRLTLTIAFCSALSLLIFSSPLTQTLVIVVSGVLGVFLFKNTPNNARTQPSKMSLNTWSVWLFCLLFVVSVLSFSSPYFDLFKMFYQSGSLVFGGGHVVLPLLQENLGQSITDEAFIMGYAAAQGVPGPMFTIATFFGAWLTPHAPLLGAFVATLAIFMPGLLLMLGFRQLWQGLLANQTVLGASTGINAAVVGLLVAAFYSPILQASILGWVDLVWVAAGWMLLKFAKAHIFILLVGFCSLGILLGP